MAHITGGGIPENLPRCLPDNLSIEVNLNSWAIPPIFKWLAKTGNVNQQDMLDTFNMGVGFVVIVPPPRSKKPSNFLKPKIFPPTISAKLSKEKKTSNLFVKPFKGIRYDRGKGFKPLVKNLVFSP